MNRKFYWKGVTMDYNKWASLKTGDRVKRKFNKLKGTIISAVGIGYVVKWDNGIIEKITNGTLKKVSEE